jgi:HSP20 family protein
LTFYIAIFFQSDLDFIPAMQSKASHPLDIYYKDDGLYFDIACIGLTKKDLDINIEGDTLRIKYEKPDTQEDYSGTIYKGLTKKSFNLGYRISSKYNLAEAWAGMENGLLKIFIPISEEAKPKVLKIK